MSWGVSGFLKVIHPVLVDSCDSQWSVKTGVFLETWNPQPCPEKSFALFLFPAQFYPCTSVFWVVAYYIVQKKKKVMRMLVRFNPELNTYSCDGRPLRQSAKLDFNEAIVFIKSNPYELHSQEYSRSSSKPTDEFISTLAFPGALEIALKWESNRQVETAHRYGLVCLKQNNPFGW